MLQSPISPPVAPPDHGRLDRLSAFLAAFPLLVRLTPASDAANLFLLSDDRDAGLRRVVFCSAAVPRPDAPGAVLVAARVDFGGDSNPLLRSLPPQVMLETRPSEPVWALTEVLLHEAGTRRCGGPAALARLGELLVLMVMRQAIENGSANSGLLAGLAHPRLRMAVGALLEQPARDWRIEDLASRCALSRSQFMLSFRKTLGMTPGTFLTAWRLTLARRRLQRGDRVKAVASASGYASAAAFSRAYSRAFGQAPAFVAPVAPEGSVSTA